MPAFPVELERADRWVRYSPKKVPLTVAGGAASSTDAGTWATHDEAMASTVGVGPGFVLNGDGIVCIDLDHCLNGRVLEPWAADILAACPGTYVEVSPSGDGLHVWGTALGFEGGRRLAFRGGMVEMYADQRYLTVTGKPFNGSQPRLADLFNVIRWILED